MEDFKEIYKNFPELIYINESPSTWKGILTAVNRHKNCDIKIKVKLVAPSFPALEDVTIFFGKNLANLFGTSFKNQIDSILKRSESLSKFLGELIAVIEQLLCDQSNREINFNCETDSRDKLLKELKFVLSERSEVEISASKNLSRIKLSMNEISLVIQPCVSSLGQNTWKIISSDLPELPGFNVCDRKSLTLKEIRNSFQKQVITLEDVWEQLRKIDNYCWVTDPIDPKPYHLYRRINLSPTLSFILTLNPLDPTGYPNIKFLGAKKEVEKYRDMIQDEDAIDKWELEDSVYENLLTLLNIDEFPVKPKQAEENEEGGMVGDEECCICFSKEIEENELPNEVCNNYRCRKNFHSTCLFQWLQELVSNKIVFNQIFGPCPNCGDEVSCNVPAS
ncbi:hypothetical protein TKK_0013141 [Trichogramma kaykai]|uniref:RING-type domain-containing protein n=1 Tax=Trichogramma kaykai TaxID=54128 RepID=A0ABD2WK20_9HYME